MGEKMFSLKIYKLDWTQVIVDSVDGSVQTSFIGLNLNTRGEMMRSCKHFPHVGKMLTFAYNWMGSVVKIVDS